ncbi:MAG TPA: cyclic nucleotide-binding domain-containing protein, partial [Chloroflexota bacterium]
LRRAFVQVGPDTNVPEDIVESHYDLLRSLEVTGTVDPEVLRRAQLVGRAYALPEAEVLRATEYLATAVTDRLEQRARVIRDYNEQYLQDVARNFSFQIGWMIIDLAVDRRVYVSEVVREHFGVRPALLPMLDSSRYPDDDHVLVLWSAQAHLAVGTPLHRYFSKRYQRALASRIDLAMAGTGHASDDAAQLLEQWDGDGLDLLPLLARAAPASTQHLFPSRIAARLLKPGAVGGALTEQTDARLWRHGVDNHQDPAAAETLRLLAALESAPLLRPLPVEVLLELEATLCPLHLDPGEVLIHEGARDCDVFVLLGGELEVVRKGAGVVDRLGPGDIVGELAFFTRAPRTATVRARMASDCLVIRYADLRLLGMRQPGVLLQMAGVIARRFTAVTNAPEVRGP